MRVYHEYAAAHGLVHRATAALPTEEHLLGFAVWLAGRGLGPDGVADHVRGVGMWVLASTGVDPRKDGGGRLRQRLARVLEGIRRTHSRHRPKRAALTTDRLRMLLRALWALPDVPWSDKLMYEAALSLGVYGLLRVSEMTHETQTRRRPHGAQRGDVLLCRDELGRATHFEYEIRRSKQDQTGAAQASVRIYAPNAVGAMDRYLSARGGGASDVLFSFEDGAYLTRRSLDRMLKRLCGLVGLDKSRFSTHSLRAGGATTLSLLGIKPYLIKKMGRWASDAYQIYIRVPDAQLQAIQERMASMGPLASDPRDMADLADQAWQALRDRLHDE